MVAEVCKCGSERETCILQPQCTELKWAGRGRVGSAVMISISTDCVGVSLVVVNVREI